MEKEQSTNKKEQGFSLVEIVIGLAIFAVGTSSILFLISQQQFLVSNKEQTMRAQTFVSEGLEATKAIAQKARFDAMRIFYRKHYHQTYSRFTYRMVMKGIDVMEKVIA